jgi:hypothetical protein
MERSCTRRIYWAGGGWWWWWLEGFEDVLMSMPVVSRFLPIPGLVFVIVNYAGFVLTACPKPSDAVRLSCNFPSGGLSLFATVVWTAVCAVVSSVLILFMCCSHYFWYSSLKQILFETFHLSLMSVFPSRSSPAMPCKGRRNLQSCRVFS